MSVKSILLFIGGIAIGAAGGILGTKKYLEDKYQKQYEKDIKDLEEYYKRTDEYVRQLVPDENVEIPADSITSGRMDKKERESVKQAIKNNKAESVNYAGMYKNKFNEVDISQEDEEAFESHQNNKNKPPKIISGEAYSNLPHSVDQEVLYYYTYDDIVCDDDNNEIEEPELLIGDTLTKYDFRNSEEEIIFVMNYEYDTCYEIQKVEGSWLGEI